MTSKWNYLILNSYLNRDKNGTVVQLEIFNEDRSVIMQDEVLVPPVVDIKDVLDERVRVAVISYLSRHKEHSPFKDGIVHSIDIEI